MVDISIRSIKAEYIIMFALGIFFLALGIYGAYYLFAVELPSGHSTRLPFAVVGSILFGLFMMLRSYSIFMPLKKNSYARSGGLSSLRGLG